MLNKILEYMKKNRLIVMGDRIVVGVSGGADSICLLHVLIEICVKQEVTLVVVHVNHGIRGEEAARDERFVEELCGRLGIEFYSYHFDVKQIAKKEGLSEEEAGRKVRYQSFLEVCRLKKCNNIAIAHNRNDNVETVLFNLFRGTGIKGLSGIEPSRVLTSEEGEVKIIRPLLCVERKEIEEYLHCEEIPYLIDSTNLTEEYSRNKIRNRVLAYVAQEINSGVIGNIAEAASRLNEIEEYVGANVTKRYQELVQETKEGYHISCQEFMMESIVIQKGIILNIMENLGGKRKDLEAKHVDAVLSLLHKQVGRYVHLPYGMIAEKEYNGIKFFCKKTLERDDLVTETWKPLKVLVPGRIFIPQNHMFLETELIKYKKNEPIPKSSCAKWFDYDKIENAVEIRTRKEGDYIQISGAGGRKKLKDYFIDQKIPQKRRDSQLLITDGNHVMWIPGEGERMSEKYKVDDSTINVLLMKMINLEENEDDR